VRKFNELKLFPPTTYYSDCCLSLFDPNSPWTMAKEKLNSPLQVAIEASGQEVPGVTESYTYFGTKNSTSTGHAEDANLFSMNYHHFGAPKHWIFITESGKKKFAE
jgi:hypothetical protein